MTDAPFNQNSFNPSFSKIADIWLTRDRDIQYEDGLRLLVKNDNPFCAFERIEMIESVFEPLPKGSLIVRDTSDIITYIKDKDYDTIVMVFLDGTVTRFAMTSLSYINNPASETDESYVSINFSNHFYKFCEQQSLVGLLKLQRPIVEPISQHMARIRQDLAFGLLDLTLEGSSLTHDGPFFRYVDATENFVLYKPLNSIESRTDIPTDNILQYLSYIASYALPKQGPVTINTPGQGPQNTVYDGKSPRFMFWTGWDNDLCFKYFYMDIENDINGIEDMYAYDHRYAVYDSDSPAIKLYSADEELTYRKIYMMSTDPADQFMSTKYYYVRKTPKFLNNTGGNTYSKLAFQYQDEGEKYDFEIVTSEGITGDVPRGANEMVDESFWGHYDSFNPLDNVSMPTHIGHDFGYQSNYLGNTFMGLTFIMPFVDCPEMWKNQFDLTNVHPNLGKPLQNPNDKTYLQKVLDIRYDTYKEKFGVNDQLIKIREIERQNFVSYVLCCLKDQREETFFAAILGYRQEEAPYDQRGVNNKGNSDTNSELLKYRYYWAKLKILGDPLAIPVAGSTFDYYTKPNEFRAFENRLWDLDIGDPPLLNGKPNGEWSGLGDTIGLLAVNLNERANWYNLIGLTLSGNTLFPYPGGGGCGSSGGYYAPGWHAKSVKDEGFEKIKYRAISHDIFDYVARVDPSGMTYPALYQGISGATTYEKRHIVRMTKTPIVELLLESGITDAELIKGYDGRFIYWFDAQNVMDGPCD